jgi:hypothetical protein
MIQLVPERNLLTAVIVTALLALWFLYLNSEAPNRGRIAWVAILIVAWMFLLNWVF